MKKYIPLLANVLAQVIFGLAFFFIKMGMAVVDQDTVKFLSFRFTVGFLVMTVILLLGIKKVNYRKGFIGLIFLCGLFNPAISQILETTSTSYAPTSQIAMYNSMLPIVMLVFSALINKEYPTRRQLMFVLVCVAACIIGIHIIRDHLCDHRNGSSSVQYDFRWRKCVGRSAPGVF